MREKRNNDGEIQKGERLIRKEKRQDRNREVSTGEKYSRK